MDSQPNSDFFGSDFEQNWQSFFPLIEIVARHFFSPASFVWEKARMIDRIRIFDVLIEFLNRFGI
jgi:hypothetical protein